MLYYIILYSFLQDFPVDTRSSTIRWIATARGKGGAAQSQLEAFSHQWDLGPSTAAVKHKHVRVTTWTKLHEIHEMVSEHLTILYYFTLYYIVLCYIILYYIYVCMFVFIYLHYVYLYVYIYISNTICQLYLSNPCTPWFVSHHWPRPKVMKAQTLGPLPPAATELEASWHRHVFLCRGRCGSGEKPRMNRHINGKFNGWMDTWSTVVSTEGSLTLFLCNFVLGWKFVA
jgi:hypothetical protein